MNTESPHIMSRLVLLAAVLLTLPVHGQERWFQIEVSIFSNERAADRNEELWLPAQTTLDYPDTLQRIQSLMDLLLIDALTADDETEGSGSIDSPLDDSSPSTALSAQAVRLQTIRRTGPFPPDGPPYFEFPDFARDPFLQLPDSASDFRQTNQALERSAEHRLLFHGLWRQPMPDLGAETPVLISSGQQYGEHRELEGSLSLHFNTGRDRVVIDADLWLSEFTSLPGQGDDWNLPPSPAAQDSVADSGSEYHPRIVYHMQQSRDMRSNEFHYLDHPALGLVITVSPYEVPPQQEAEPPTTQ